MEIEGNIEVPPTQTKETYVHLSAQDPQLQLQEQDAVHEKEYIHEEVPMKREYPIPHSLYLIERIT